MVALIREVKNKIKFEYIFSQNFTSVEIPLVRKSLTRGSKYSETFGILENWSLRRGGRYEKFHCILKHIDLP